jgi:hypothetical protein
MERRYKIDFHTPLGRGTGVVFLLEDGRLIGGDSHMFYSGTYAIDADDFTAEVWSKRHSIALNVQTVWGRDSTHMLLVGKCNGNTIRVNGTSPDVPDVTIDVRFKLDEG